ncbi:Peptidase family M20/M25/M40 [Verrucomicrobiia bacterium DG1235]|nr:Peptidase family M20/M25/M40 [Verrucomicrobiae bacterium DG1235]
MTDSFDEGVALELLSRLVRINSVNPVYGGPGESGVADFVCDWLTQRGIGFRRQSVAPGRDNVYARIGPDDSGALLIEAHMDTVGTDGWAKGDPHELSCEGSRHFARGACDTKSSLACFMLTLEYFAKHPERLGRPIVFAATVDEESEQLGAYELAKLKQELGIVLALTGEPTCSDVIARHKGVGRYLITARGKAVHASAPELGENAIYKAARICRKLEKHAEELEARPRNSEIERGTLNVGVMRGGIGFNVVPDSCQLDVDRRFGSGETESVARGELEAICRTEAGVDLSVFLERPALRGLNSGSFVAEMLAAGKTAGHSIIEREVPYMTNAVSYEAAGIPAIVWGPGDIAQAHKNDEFIESGELIRSLSILDAFLRKA